MRPETIKALSDDELIDDQFGMTTTLKDAILSADPRAAFKCSIRLVAEHACQARHQFTNLPEDERTAWAERLERLAHSMEGKP